jgi:hypothetical protein
LKTQLEQFVDKLDELINSKTGKAAGDALDMILNQAPRITNVVSVKDHPAIKNVKEQISQGYVLAGTVQDLLKFATSILGTIVK